ncbi:hypothetical protein K458DRAFT_402296 [Lentithecium fluviatile CBS 122367]|uniref:Uncharacterized protein n=1 Tax=Lentithecium fluviatile CBS 122367 TaxID=1168545 RepID=A0A6G1J932_9PLEO|nr:hypothetical protein K458DRAFT_402296 [Lentithecium fluviatile CBS 122367]
MGRRGRGAGRGHTNSDGVPLRCLPADAALRAFPASRANISFGKGRSRSESIDEDPCHSTMQARLSVTTCLARAQALVRIRCWAQQRAHSTPPDTISMTWPVCVCVCGRWASSRSTLHAGDAAACSLWTAPWLRTSPRSKCSKCLCARSGCRMLNRRQRAPKTAARGGDGRCPTTHRKPSAKKAKNTATPLGITSKRSLDTPAAASSTASSTAADRRPCPRP